MRRWAMPTLPGPEPTSTRRLDCQNVSGRGGELYSAAEVFHRTVGPAQGVASDGAGLASRQSVGRIISAPLRNNRHIWWPQELQAAPHSVPASSGAVAARTSADGKLAHA